MKWSIPCFETTSVGEKGEKGQYMRWICFFDSSTLHHGIHPLAFAPRPQGLRTVSLCNYRFSPGTLHFNADAKPKPKPSKQVFDTKSLVSSLFKSILGLIVGKERWFSIWRRPWLLSTLPGPRTTGPSLKCIGEDSQPELTYCLLDPWNVPDRPSTLARKHLSPHLIKRTRTWALVPIRYPNIPKYTIALYCFNI